MDFLELAERRVSVRGFTEAPVAEEALDAVIEAARLAPSACNRQPWHLVVIRDEARRRLLGEAYPQAWFVGAPVILALCVEPAAGWQRSDGKSYVDVDGAIAMDHITLCAADLGLGTCWIGAFEAHAVRRILHLPPGIEPLALTPLGHPADAGRPKKRKPREALVHDEQW